MQAVKLPRNLLHLTAVSHSRSGFHLKGPGQHPFFSFLFGLEFQMKETVVLNMKNYFLNVITTAVEDTFPSL